VFWYEREGDGDYVTFPEIFAVISSTSAASGKTRFKLQPLGHLQARTRPAFSLGKISSVIPDVDNYSVSSFDPSVSETRVAGDGALVGLMLIIAQPLIHLPP